MSPPRHPFADRVAPLPPASGSDRHTLALTLWGEARGEGVAYRQDGKQKVRSLRTTNKREAIRLQREIEALVQNNSPNGFTVMEKPVTEEKNPTFDEFWPEFLE